MKKAISSKFQKILAVIIAATMLLATFVSALPVLADSENSYNGQKLGFYTHKYPNTLKVDSITHNVSNFANGITTSVLSYVAKDADITPENYAAATSTGIVYYDETDVEALAAAAEISATTAFMFYVKLPATQPETKVTLSGQTYAEDGTNAQYPILWTRDADAYILSADSPVWETVKTVRFGVEPSGVANAAAVTLPAGFEGWVRVPFSLFRVNNWDSNKLYRMNFYFDHYSATEPFSYGASIIVDKATENLSALTIEDKTVNLIEKAAYNTEALSLGDFTTNKYYSLTENSGSIAQTAVLFDNENGKNFELSVGEDFTGKGYASDYYTAEFAAKNNSGGWSSGGAWATLGWKGDITNEFVSTNGFVFSSETSADLPADQSHYFGIKFIDSSNNDQNLTWDSNHSIIFYVANTGIKANKLSFLFEGSGVYSHLLENQTYYLLADGSTEWKSDTTATAYDGSWGYIDVPAGFVGYVRIPCGSFQGPANNVQTGTAKKAYVYPRNVGGDYGSFTVGAFGTVDKTTENLMYIATSATENEPVVMANSVANAVNRTEPTGVVKANDAAITWVGNTVSATDYNQTQLNTGKSNYMFVNDAPISSSGSILFHVVNTSSQLAKVCITGNEWRGTFKDKDYYLLADGSAIWDSKITLDDANTDRNGYIEIPANFSGWIKIPMASFNSTLASEATLTKFGLFPLVLNGSLTFTNIMTTAANNNSLYINDGKIIGLSNPDNGFDTAIDYNVQLSGGKIVTNASNGALNVSADVLSDVALNAGESLMFYAKAPSAAKFTLGLSDTNILKDSFTYYTVDYNSLWVEKAVTDGLVSIDAGFEGWVRIPTSAFSSTDISKVSISFVDATEGIAVSDFMVTDKATYELDYIVICGKKVSLFVELYDANTDGEIDARDIVRLKKFVAQFEGINVPALAGDIDRSSDIDITDVSILRNGLLNGFKDSTGEVALSRYLAEEGYTTAANYTSATATVNNVNF